MNEIIRYNSTDKDIAAVKCYVSENLNGSPLYRDKDRTELIPKEEALELFNKGLITVEYGYDGDNVMNAKPIFIITAELNGIDFDEEAGYGVIFFMLFDHEGSSLEQLYVNIGDRGPYGMLYRDPDLTTQVSFDDAVNFVENGSAIVYASEDGNVIFAAKPTCVVRSGSDSYEVKFPF